MRIARFIAGVSLLAGGHLRVSAGRSLYLVASVAVCSATTIGLSALTPSHAEADTNATKIVVGSAREGSLPLRYVDAIAHLPNVATLAWSNYLPLLCATGGTATLNGYAGAATQAMLASDYAVPPDVIAAWNDDPMGILIGEKLAGQCGWRKGMHLTPRDGFRGNPVEIHIIDVVHSTSDAPFANQIAIAHYEHLDRQAEPGQSGRLASILVVASDAARAPSLAAAIEDAFLQADPPVEAQTNPVAAAGIDRFGSAQWILRAVMAAIVACTTLVMVGTLAHAARERRRVFATLQALGFGRSFLFAAFAAEFGLLTALGVGAGCVGGFTTVAWLAPGVSAVLGEFAVPRWIGAALPSLLLLVLAISLIVPAAAIARTRGTDCRAA